MVNDYIKGIKQGIGFTFILSIITVVSAVGFHSANEILSGTFLGNYTFHGNVNLTNANVIGFSSVPSGAILAFNSSVCPEGWLAANGSNGTVDLRGIFIRGIDNGRGIDKNRSLGSFQNDSIQEHGHDIWGGSSSKAGMLNDYAYHTSGHIYAGTAKVTNARVSNETRPKNIALLYCQKK